MIQRWADVHPLPVPPSRSSMPSPRSRSPGARGFRWSRDSGSSVPSGARSRSDLIAVARSRRPRSATSCNPHWHTAPQKASDSPSALFLHGEWNALVQLTGHHQCRILLAVEKRASSGSHDPISWNGWLDTLGSRHFASGVVPSNGHPAGYTSPPERVRRSLPDAHLRLRRPTRCFAMIEEM